MNVPQRLLPKCKEFSFYPKENRKFEALKMNLIFNLLQPKNANQNKYSIIKSPNCVNTLMTIAVKI